MIAQYLGRQQRMEVASSHQVMPSQLTWLVAQPLISYSSMKVDLTLNLESTTAQPLITTTFPQKKLLRSLERPYMQCNALPYLNQWWWKTCFSPSNTADASWIMAVTCATSPCIGLPVEKECRQCRQQKMVLKSWCKLVKHLIFWYFLGYLEGLGCGLFQVLVNHIPRHFW